MALTSALLYNKAFKMSRKDPLRGAFLAGGSVTDPEKGYHMEFSTTHQSVSRGTCALMREVIGFDPKVYQAGTAGISWLLTPATVCLAVPLYEQWMTLKKNALAVLCGITAGSVTSMTCVIAMSWLLKLDPVLSASLMPKSVTSAIGAEVAAELGGIGSLAGALIILTGIVGNLSAAALCRICKLHDPVARGVAIGTGSHAVGTSRALQMGRIEGAVSSLSIAVAGVLTAILCPILANFLP